jgi:hypothetical protein
MSVTAPQRVLLDALMLPLPQAGDAWRSWRASTDLDHLDNTSFHLLSALAGRMQDWLVDDPQQAILLGICRRAWSQNQVRRKLLADALEVLDAAGIKHVAATGPVLWGALYWPEGAIRPIGVVDLLVQPASVRPAFEALSKAGWKSPNGIPDTAGRKFYFAPGALLQSPSGGDLRMHWRALPNTDLSILRPKFPPLKVRQPGQVAPLAMPAEHSLVAVLGGHHEDEVDWHYDALMICRHPGLRWETVAALLRWRSTARERLGELRRDWDWRAEIPLAVTKPRWTRYLVRILAFALRVYRRIKGSTSTLVSSSL